MRIWTRYSNPSSNNQSTPRKKDFITHPSSLCITCHLLAGGGVRMGLQKSACKRGRTSSISGLLTNLQIKKFAKVYSKIFIPGPWRVRRARAALSAEPAAAIERSQRSRATSANQASEIRDLHDSKWSRKVAGMRAQGGNIEAIFSGTLDRKPGRSAASGRIDDARRGQSHPATTPT